MEIENKLLYCKKCSHKGVSADNELICSLTNSSPSYTETCADFLISEKSPNDVKRDDVVKRRKRKPMFRKIFSTIGRITRTEYVLSRVFFNVLILASINLVTFYEDNTSFFLVLFPLLLWFRIAFEVKRIHDVGNSWPYIFVPFYSLILIFGDGTLGDNKYGENPKGIINKVINKHI